MRVFIFVEGGSFLLIFLSSTGSFKVIPSYGSPVTHCGPSACGAQSHTGRFPRLLTHFRSNRNDQIPPLTLNIYLNISMHILHTVLFTFPKVLARRICLTISRSTFLVIISSSNAVRRINKSVTPRGQGLKE